MLEDVEIENFRCFATLRHSGFTRVNLIVGKNNSGKTALLEALEALVSADSPYVLYRSSIERGETREHRAKSEGIAVDARHWFHGHRLEVGSEFRISTALLDGAPAWLKRSIVDDPDRDLGLGITLERDVGRPPRMPFILPISNDGFLGTAAPAAIQEFGEALKSPVVFRTTRRPGVGELSAAWSKVVLTTAEDEVVQALQILDSSVERLAITGSNGDATAQLRLRGEQFPVPLSSMGEGMTRMLTISSPTLAARYNAPLTRQLDCGSARCPCAITSFIVRW